MRGQERHGKMNKLKKEAYFGGGGVFTLSRQYSKQPGPSIITGYVEDPGLLQITQLFLDTFLFKVL